MGAIDYQRPAVAADVMTQDRRHYAYKAFLSYSHKDERRAKRLHRRLEQYRIPKSLRQGHVHLGAIFRDKEELSAASELDASIKAALRASEYLIVLCSPSAVGSLWVDKEIAYFKALGREDRILAVMLSGYPYTLKQGYAAVDECFPPSLRFDLSETGEIISERAEPLAVDLRPGGDGEKIGLLKLVSGLLGLGLDQVLQRQLVRAKRRMMSVIVGSSVLISVFAGLAWTTHTARNQAEARQADAENFVEFILSDLSLQLETSGRLDLLEAVGAKAIGYYAQFDEDDLDSRANSQRARTFHFMGELQNSLGKTRESIAFFEDAYALTEQELAAEPNNSDRIFEHARSAYLRTLPLRRARDLEGQFVHLQEYESLAKRLAEAEVGSARSISQQALACLNLGRVRLRTDALSAAQEDLNCAETLFERLNAIDPSVENLLNQTENMAWLAELFKAQDKFNLSYDYRVRQNRLLDERLETDPDDFRLIEASVYAKLGLGNAASLSGLDSVAKKQLNFALDGTRNALKLEPKREKMRRAQSIALLGIMKIAIAENDRGHLQSASAAMKHLQSAPLTTSIGDNKYWDEILPRLIADLEPKPH